MELKKVLITGGAGFIGTHLARQLLNEDKGREIVSLDVRDPERPVRGVTYLKHNVEDPFDLTIRGRFDIVYNLAAVHRTPGHAEFEYYETNVRGALNTVAYCARNGIDRLVFTSSIAVYGPSERPLTELSALRPNSAYGRSKRIAEDIHTAWALADRSRRLRIVRPAVIYGAGENGNYTRLAKLLKRGLFVFPGRDDTRKACGYVKELVRSIRFALNRPEQVYLYNFASPHVPTTREICDHLVAVTGVSPPRGTLPLWILETGARVFELLNAIGLRNEINRERIHKLIYSTNVVAQRLIDDGYTFAYPMREAFLDWLADDPSIGNLPGVQLVPKRLISIEAEVVQD